MIKDYIEGIKINGLFYEVLLTIKRICYLILLPLFIVGTIIMIISSIIYEIGNFMDKLHTTISNKISRINIEKYIKRGDLNE